MQLQDYVADVQELVHDAIGVSWPVSRVVSRINDARLMTSMDMKCVRQLVTGVQLIPGQEVYNVGPVPGALGGAGAGLSGAVVGANVTAAGSNFGSGSTVQVTFAPPPMGGTQALGFGNLTGGALSSITMTQWGQGYTAVPAITIGGVGSGAAASPVTIFNLLYPLNITYIFNNIRTMLRYLPFSLFQAYARVLSTQFLSTPGVWSFIKEAGQVYIEPLPNQNYTSEWDCMFFSSPLVNLTDTDTQIVDPWSRAPQFAAASLLLMTDQDAGRARAAFMQRQYDRMVPKIVNGVGNIKVPNIYNRTFQRMVAR
jgi:hypothetical protein